jgi:hypothetical protein
MQQSHPSSQHNYIVGIDPGVNTGIAVWVKSDKKIAVVATMMIHEAMILVRAEVIAFGKRVFIRVEDPRQAIYGRRHDQHKLKGAGSVMRDAKIWEDFLISLKVDFEMVRPQKAITKFSALKFKVVTGYEGATSEHARDAAMLVYGY